MAKAAPAAATKRLRAATKRLRAVLGTVDEQEEAPAHAVVPEPALTRHPAGFPECQANLDHITWVFGVQFARIAKSADGIPRDDRATSMSEVVLSPENR
jgi:hypothetical protein